MMQTQNHNSSVQSPSNGDSPPFFYHFPSRAQAWQSLKQLPHSHCQLWSLHGLSGLGKRSLVRHFTDTYPPRDVIWINGVAGLSPQNLWKAIARTWSLTEPPFSLPEDRLPQHATEQLKHLDRIRFVVITQAEQLPPSTLAMIAVWLEKLAACHAHHLRFILIGEGARPPSIGAQSQSLLIHAEDICSLDRQDVEGFLRQYRKKILPQTPPITPMLVARVHRLTGGYLKRIVHLSHQAIVQASTHPHPPMQATLHATGTKKKRWLQSATTCFRRHGWYGLMLLILIGLVGFFGFLHGWKPKLLHEPTHSEVARPHIQQKQPKTWHAPFIKKATQRRGWGMKMRYGPEGYTVQVIGTHRFDRLLQFVQKNHLNALKHHLFYYHVVDQIQPWHVLTYGHASSYQQARQLLREVTASVHGSTHPWIRKRRSIYQNVP